MKKTLDSNARGRGTVPDFVRYVFPRAGAGSARTGGSPCSWDDAVREEEIQLRERKSRQEGLEEGEQRARQSLDVELQRERAMLTEALDQLEQDRASYYRRAETEVVNLALAITRKILQREVAMDTLVLRGAVRVALDRIQSATDIRLRVCPEDAARWQELLDGDETLASRPEVTSDATLDPGQCVVETSLGSTDLAWENQLKEVEQSFHDLMAMKPVDE